MNECLLIAFVLCHYNDMFLFHFVEYVNDVVKYAFINANKKQMLYFSS